MDKPILTTSQLTKLYPGTIALDKADYIAHTGKVNVLIGENGAGKSTLMKLIAGVEMPSSGKIIYEDKEIHLSSVKDAEKHGIGIIFQELNLIPHMSILDNMYLGIEETHRGVIDKKKQKEKAQKILNSLELDVNLDTNIADLRVGQQQLVEIAKALVKDVRLLIMDEPTSALSNAEVEILFRVIASLKEKGVTIIYISHRLEELIRIGDYISILRDGKLISITENKGISVDWIVKEMVGDVDRKQHNPRLSHYDEPAILSARHITMYDELGKRRVNNVSFDMYKGELLGIYGLMGSGRSELFEALFGVAKNVEGSISFKGEEIKHLSLSQRLKLGMGLVPEDRKNQAVIPPLNIRQNMSLASLFRFIYKKSWLKNNEEKNAVNQEIKNLSIKTPSGESLLTALSGGNQQKVVIAKSLMTKPSLLLLDECTRGVDVGAKAEIFDIVQKLVDSNKVAIAFTSSDLKEIMDNADRILVMSNGKVAGEFLRSQVTETQLVQASAQEL